MWHYSAIFSLKFSVSPFSFVNERDSSEHVQWACPLCTFWIASLVYTVRSGIITSDSMSVSKDFKIQNALQKR